MTLLNQHPPDYIAIDYTSDEKAAPFPQPEPLFRENELAEPFPLEALGSTLGDATKAIIQQVQCPSALAAQSVLAAASLAVQAHANVVLPVAGGRTTPISSFFLTIAKSGERKSTADNIALAAIHRHEACLRLDYESKLDAYTNDHDAWSAKRTKILNAAKQATKREDIKRDLDNLGPAPQAPTKPILICEEPTLEGTIKLYLNAGQPSLGVFSAEGGAFVGGHGMQQEAKLRTAAGLSNFWDGTPIKRVRAGDGASTVANRRLAIHLMVQPSVAEILLSDRLLQDQGLLNRMLISWPQSTMGERTHQCNDTTSIVNLERYNAQLSKILNTQIPLATHNPFELDPKSLHFTPDAASAWQDYGLWVETLIAADAPLAEISGFAAKAAEYAARLAGTLTLFDDIEAREIDVATVNNSIVLMKYYTAEHRRIVSMGYNDPDLALAQRTYDWLCNDWEHFPRVSLPDLYQRGPNAIRSKSKANKMMQILEEHHLATKIEGGAIVGDHPRRNVWSINNTCV